LVEGPRNEFLYFVSSTVLVLLACFCLQILTRHVS
jgi:hypothetical protein